MDEQHSRQHLLIEQQLAEVVQQSMTLALQQHRAGQLEPAETLYRSVLAVLPQHADANHNLGVLAVQTGHSLASLAYFQQALEAAPRNLQYHSSLIDALIQCGELDLAGQALQQAWQAGLSGAATGELVSRLVDCGIVAAQTAAASIKLPKSLRQPSLADQTELAELFEHQQYAQLERRARAMIRRHPALLVGWRALGAAQLCQGQDDAAALGTLQQTLRLAPTDAVTLSNYGLALSRLGRHVEAEISLRMAVFFDPEFADAHYKLGIVLYAQRLMGLAEQAFRRCLAINPRSAAAQRNLGIVLDEQGRASEAEVHVRLALQIDPNHAGALSDLGYLLKDQGKLDESVALFRRSIAQDASRTEPFSNLLFTLNYLPDASAAEIFQDYLAFDQRFGQSLRSGWRAHTNQRNANRRLRVGYVCPVFHQHSSRMFLEPLLAHHDHAAVELFAYAQMTRRADAMTQRYQGYVDHWCQTQELDDSALAERIRADGIDILVDIAGHTRGNRLLVFARKPAPVALHWLDFGYTTGLSAIDYYLSDWPTVPPGGEALFSETPWRLDRPALAYRPVADMGEVSPAPLLRNGFVTFGSLSRAVRINHRVVRVWAALLRQVPNARLVINSSNFREKDQQQKLLAQFVAHGVSPERLDIGFCSPPWDVLRSIDIGLDCFPHNCGTTLLESLYMGLPFVTLAGRPSVGTLGAAVLHGVGCPQWVAETETDYIDKAVTLASDQTALVAWRASLRGQLQASALMDEVGFTRCVETAFRQMFQHWCEQTP